MLKIVYKVGFFESLLDQFLCLRVILLFCNRYEQRRQSCEQSCCQEPSLPVCDKQVCYGVSESSRGIVRSFLTPIGLPMGIHRNRSRWNPDERTIDTCKPEQPWSHHSSEIGRYFHNHIHDFSMCRPFHDLIIYQRLDKSPCSMSNHVVRCSSASCCVFGGIS